MAMLNKLQLSDFKSTNHIASENNAKVLELYKNLKESAIENVTTIEELVHITEDMKLEPKTVDIESTRQKLVSLGITYTVSVFQEDPLILLLQAVGPNDKMYTFIETRGTYSKCHQLLLETALEGIKILSN